MNTKTSDLEESLTQEYVCGFNFVRQEPSDPWRVVLIKKLKPFWQSGLLNGVGGKIERGETSLAAMQREYLEETGDAIQPVWHLFVTLVLEKAIVHFFKAHSFETAAHTTTDEEVFVLDYNICRTRACISNLHWLLPMALHTSDKGTFYYD